MIGKQSVLGVIPARGGSKRLPGKNLRPLGGKPLIAWSIAAAQRSRVLDRVVLSSDDPGILHVAEELGCEGIPRPAELASDTASSVDTVLHAVDACGEDPDWVVLLQPTSPLRSSGDIDECVRQTVESGASCGVTVCEPEHSPYVCVRIDAEGRIDPLLPVDLSHARSQDLPQSYRITGSVYVASASWLRSKRTFLHRGTLAWPVPRSRSADIDTEDDLRAVEDALARRGPSR